MSRRWVVVVLIFLGILISYVDRGNLSIVAVPLMEEFQLSTKELGILMSAFFWTYALFQAPAGYLIDRFGIRVTYFVALGGWSLACAAAAWSQSFSQLLMLRLLLGLGEAVSPLASLTYIKQNFEEDKQGLPTAIYVAGLTAGPGIGAYLGAHLLDAFGWRQVFLLTGVAGLLWLIPWWLLAPKRSSATAQKQKAAPLPLGALLRSPVIWALWSGMFFYSYFWYFVLNWMPPYLVMNHGFTTLQMGNTLAKGLIGMAFVNMASAWLADQIIKRKGAALVWRMTFILTGFVAASSLLLVLAAPTAGQVVATLVFSACSLGVSAGNLWALSQMLAPPGIVGRVIGLQNMMAQFGGILAPTVTGFLLGPEKNFTVAIWIAGLCPLVSAIVFLAAIRPSTVARLHASLEPKAS